jgi:dTDP-D-glucose 4,6-dehydratase
MQKLNWQPKTNIDLGLVKTIEYFKERFTSGSSAVNS